MSQVTRTMRRQRQLMTLFVHLPGRLYDVVLCYAVSINTWCVHYALHCSSSSESSEPCFMSDLTAINVMNE